MSPSTRAFAVAGLLALLLAAALHVLVLADMWSAWGAMVHVTLFGWISGLIYAVNYHTMPVFTARDFPHPRLIWAHWALLSGGIAIVTAGFLGNWQTITAIGLLLQ